MGYCPFVLQEKKLYCRNSAGLVTIQKCIAGWKAGKKKLYCERRGCVAIEELGGCSLDCIAILRQQFDY